LYTNAIFPTNSSGAPNNGVVDLGIATYYKFKDLHLSGQVNTSTISSTSYIRVDSASGGQSYLTLKDNSYTGDYIQMRDSANGLDNVFNAGGGAIFNEGGKDKDFRVESNNNSNMLIVDAGNDEVGIGGGPAGNQGRLQVVPKANGVLYYRPSGNTSLKTFSGGTGADDWIMMEGNYQDTTHNVGLAMLDYNGNFGQYAGSYIRTEGARVRIGHFIGGASTAENASLADNFTFDTAGGAVFNERGANGDFRVESDTDSNAMILDGPTGDLLIGWGGGQYNDPGYNGVGGISLRGSSSKPTIICSKALNDSPSNFYSYRYDDGSGQTADRNHISFNDSRGGAGTISSNSTGVTYNTTSDRRLKDNIEPIADGTEKLMAMKPVTHTWKANPNTGETVHGFIAQEMQEIIPEAVSGDPDGEEMMSMDYGRITPVLVAALQDAHKKIEALEERLAELEAT
jgi:hypothetical protein